MSLAGLLSEDSQQRSQGFEAEALKMIQNGILIDTNLEEERTGIETDIEKLSQVAVTEVTKMLGTYNKWLDDNYDNNGSYFDTGFKSEMKGCELASKFVGSLSNK